VPILMHHSKKCLLLFFCLLITACQSAVRTDIATYRDEQLTLIPGSVRVVPDSEETSETLEFRYFKDKLEIRLGAAGFRAVEAETADYTARLGYSVSRQEKDKPNSRVFIGGHVGYYGGYGHYPRGSVLIADGGDEFEYVRELAIAIDRAPAADGEAKQLLQVKATSVGRCEHLTVVYDEMLDAVFNNLMRADGSVEKVTINGDTRCP